MFGSSERRENGVNEDSVMFVSKTLCTGMSSSVSSTEYEYLQIDASSGSLYLQLIKLPSCSRHTIQWLDQISSST